MFTGLITDVGLVATVTELSQGKRFRVNAAYDTASFDIGASIAHNGVCLTVVAKDGGCFDVEVWEEALRLTTLGSICAGDPVNLERSLKIGDELGGHLVSGHVDGIAEIAETKEEGDAVRFTIDAPDHLARFIATKGSVALDGTSLTVNQVEGTRFNVLLIRHSLEVTTWGTRKTGELVNLEVDQMARYAARLAEFS